MSLLVSQLTNEEFRTALYLQNTIRNGAILTFNRNRPSDDPRAYECACDGTSKSLGLYRHHFVGCKVNGNANILHDAVVYISVAVS